jgi:hypothetical protein
LFVTPRSSSGNLTDIPDGWIPGQKILDTRALGGGLEELRGAIAAQDRLHRRACHAQALKARLSRRSSHHAPQAPCSRRLLPESENCTSIVIPAGRSLSAATSARVRTKAGSVAALALVASHRQVALGPVAVTRALQHHWPWSAMA